ncbi:transposase [Peribacillus cavernae]|nr:transposase [Peribacillus cavernae]
MNSTMDIPGLKEAIVTKVDEAEGVMRIFVEMEPRTHRCPQCNARTNKIHDYRIQKIHHIKWFERTTQIFIDVAVMCVTAGNAFQRKHPLLSATRERQ